MRKARAYRSKDGKTVADPCLIADSTWSRLIGLMGLKHLDCGAGLLLEPCNSIHTFFMCFTIDAVYLDDRNVIVAIHRGIRPWRFDFPVWRATRVLELNEGGASDLEPGDALCIS